EEGQQVDLGEQVFQLTLGRPVRFPLFSSTSDRVERAGEVVPVAEDMEELPPIHTVLKGNQNQTGAIPVHLRSALTEIGTLELWCVSGKSPEQWRLEFELRGTVSQAGLTVTESMPPRFSAAREAVEHIFGGKGGFTRAPTGGATATTPAKEAK